MFTEEFAYAGGDTEPDARSTRDHGNGRRSGVLIVEDERVARRALRSLLSASGYATEVAESAEEALNLLTRQPPPRVALVDLNLPGMSGLDFIRRLEQVDPTVVAVLMTAAGDETLAAALDEHRQPVPYLRKPLDFQRLLAVIGERDPSH